MISVEIPNDIAEYKPKLILGLTGRQVGLVIVTAGLIFLDMTFLKPFIGDLAIMLAAVPAVFAAMLGWFEPYGMPFEKYLKSAFIQAFVAPKVRRHRTTSSLVVPCDKFFVPISDDDLTPEVLACVEYVREQANIEPPVDSTKVSLKKAKKAAKKYIKSKKAMR